ncbi:MAG: lipoprotein-releasing ABC transporter permease subunit [Rhodospirillaceae bacterium]|nr:lipoprotein-releasing ABC transporter permease subunit [Rhodospirillaceae bacterium]
MLSTFERMVAFRYLWPGRKETFTFLVAMFSLLGIGFGVFTLIVVMSVMGGFREELLSRVLGLQPHMVVRALDGAITDYEPLVEKARAVAGVETAAPIIRAEVLARGNRGVTGALVYGIKADDLERKKRVMHGMSAGALQLFSEGDGVIIGHRLANKLRLDIGDSIRIIAPSVTATALGSVPRARAYRVVGTFNVDMSEYDSSFVFMPLRLAQIHFKYRGTVSSLEISVDNPDQVREMRAPLWQALGTDVRLSDWQQINATYFSVLEVEQNVMFLILLLIVIVAAFNIISSMIMLVKSKGRQIAILRTIGATRGQIMRIFFINGALIGIVGTLVGTVGGILFAVYIEPIRKFVEGIFGTRLFPHEFYFLAQLPTRIDAGEIAVVAFLALALSFLATLYPAWRAAKVDPVEALRHE